MNDRLLSFLGLCKRAGFLISGADTVAKSMRDHKALLVLSANDFSENSLKAVRKAADEFRKAADEFKVTLKTIDYSKDELSFALGKHCGVIGVTDKGFADKILLMLREA